MDKIEVKKRADDLGTFQWPLMGYAPGYYMRPCLDCKAVMTHCDKRATQCLSCALTSILATRTDATPVAWMPIESAPKDGTRILAVETTIPFITRWVPVFAPVYAYEGPGWYHHEMDRRANPTHWQPLPAAPDATNTHPPATDVAALVEAAKAARDDLEMVIAPPLVDPHILNELRELCSKHGYGNVMASASALWRHLLGEFESGAFVAGPCVGTVNNRIAELSAALAPFTKGQP